MNEAQLRKFDLMRRRWQLLNGRATCDPELLPAALSWLDGEIAALNVEKTSSEVGVA
ncbi:hypothetical protein [Paenibacillus senegalimassiliensis]|uniref:hypothetical protein n=1 Tax=Paenibacillus senegalimassiliensis TaxID=1737426 RepID=UPI000AF42F12|nr:hypothetical protein [Paenibacillus senegalimassiliensis]